PAEALQRAWHTVLLLQFHDILPGSSIAWVHREAEQRHAAVSVTLEGIIADALAALAGDGPAVALNASPVARAGIRPLGAGIPASAPGVTTSRVDGGDVLDNGVLR